MCQRTGTQKYSNKICGTNIEEVTGKWRKLHCDEFIMCISQFFFSVALQPKLALSHIALRFINHKN